MNDSTIDIHNCVSFAIASIPSGKYITLKRYIVFTTSYRKSSVKVYIIVELCIKILNF